MVMALNYACFISHRHGQFEIMKSFIKDFYLALSAELDLLLEKKVFLDQERLKGGYFYNQALATALCESACMIMVFTPRYFSMENSYCAREYKAMEDLEKARLPLLGPSNGKLKGLIIPVVLRSVDSLPAEIKDHRQYHDFSKFTLSERKMMRNPRYEPKIKEIAQYIDERYKCLMAVSDQLPSDCKAFSFPTEDEISAWLGEVTNPQPQAFPGRTRRWT
jgi:hypothetical protein